MTISLSRRRIVGALAVAGSGLAAGCDLGGVERRPGRVFVENETGETRRIALALTDPDGAVVLRGRYTLPAEYALRFSDAIGSAPRYRLRVDLLGNGEATYTVETCDPDERGERMDVAVRISRDQLDFVEYRCDRPYTYREGLTYVDAAEYAVETGTGTTAA